MVAGMHHDAAVNDSLDGAVLAACDACVHPKLQLCVLVKHAGPALEGKRALRVREQQRRPTTVVQRSSCKDARGGWRAAARAIGGVLQRRRTAAHGWPMWVRRVRTFRGQPTLMAALKQLWILLGSVVADHPGTPPYPSEDLGAHGRAAQGAATGRVPQALHLRVPGRVVDALRVPAPRQVMYIVVEGMDSGVWTCTCPV